MIAGHAVRASAAGDPSDLAGPRGDGLAAVWAADARFAAHQVGVLLGTHVDRRTVAYVGHSFGGAAALEACRQDATCTGAVDLDGTPYGPVVHEGLQKPLLMLSSGVITLQRSLCKGLEASLRFKTYVAVDGITTLVILVLSPICVRVWGLNGAAVAMMVGFAAGTVVVAVVLVDIVTKMPKVPPSVAASEVTALPGQQARDRRAGG